ncbi:MAG: cobaltochelatase subunit CobN, partial [Rhizobiales bacterium]|nr:cobaltochelatase subunit CobN [Hyphomicrobiales bacterium]
MHLLAVQPGAIDDGARAVDLDQSPADIVFLSAADTEIASLALAHKRLGEAAPQLRIANLLQLGHAMSVDLYVERTLYHARVVIARLLGGRGYWPYGVEELTRLARQNGLVLALLPGDHRPDDELMRASTLEARDYQALWHYFTEGGVDNMARALGFAGHLTGRGPRPEQAQPVP